MHRLAFKFPRQLHLKSAMSTEAIGKAPRLVSTDWVDRNIGLIAPVDGTWHLPTLQRNAKEEYQKCHLKNARFFDIDGVCDKTSSLPHMLPKPEEFSRIVGEELGISDSDHVVVYDTYGLGPAARVWWTFKVMGHDKVSIMEGGLPKWVAEGRPVMDVPAKIKPKFYKVKNPNYDLVRNFDQIQQIVKDWEQGKQDAVILDARPAGRFQGKDAEPRPRIPSGHVPHSFNIPWNNLVDPKTHSIISQDELKKIIEEKGIDLSKPVVTMCGSGVTGALLLFSLLERGLVKDGNISLYDGSWSEYASKEADGAVVEDRGPRISASGGWLK